MPNVDLSDRSHEKYLSISKHQRNARNDYSKWETLDLEIETFNNEHKGSIDNTFQESWLCQNNLWGFSKALNNIKIVGTEKQQFGFFETPRNPTDHWHGYPIIPSKIKKDKHCICKNLLTKWEENNHFTADEIAIIAKGKLYEQNNHFLIYIQITIVF